MRLGNYLEKKLFDWSLHIRYNNVISLPAVIHKQYGF